MWRDHRLNMPRMIDDDYDGAELICIARERARPDINIMRPIAASIMAHRLALFKQCAQSSDGKKHQDHTDKRIDDDQ